MNTVAQIMLNMEGIRKYEAKVIHFVVLLSLLADAVVGSISGFTDNTHFAINWAGPLTVELNSENGQRVVDNEVVILTSNKEQYHCLIPDLVESTVQDDNGVSPKQIELELLKPLFDQTTCTYRLETYWTYELCHGRHLRQFHQETQPEKLQEYYLGRYDLKEYPKALSRAKEALLDQKTKQSNKLKKVQGVEVPYYEVLYTDGTVCDLTGKARRVFIQYVCQPDGKGEVYELKETSSCEYEAVVLTSLLCAHPAYGPKKDRVNSIQCHSIDKSPLRPLSLDNLELENTASRFSRTRERVIGSIWEALNSIIDKTNKAKDADSADSPSADNPYLQPLGRARTDLSGGHFILGSTEPVVQASDKLVLQDFLAGTYCVQGGTGWWKQEFCYGKQVTQFHEEKTGSRVNVILGVWDIGKHLEWLSNNPNKQPKPVDERKTITQFYSNGEVCDLTGQKRFVEVRLKCSPSANHPNSIALYMVEPKPCEYKLVIESQILCPLIKQANPFGLIPDQPNI